MGTTLIFISESAYSLAVRTIAGSLIAIIVVLFAYTLFSNKSKYRYIFFGLVFGIILAATTNLVLISLNHINSGAGL